MVTSYGDKVKSAFSWLLLIIMEGIPIISIMRSCGTSSIYLGKCCSFRLQISISQRWWQRQGFSFWRQRKTVLNFSASAFAFVDEIDFYFINKFIALTSDE